MEKYHEIFQELPLPAIIFSGDGLEEDVNDAFSESFKNLETRNQLFASLQNDIEQFKISNDKNITIEKTIDLSDNSKKIFRVRLSRILFDSPSGLYLALFTDITERRRQIEEICQLASIVDSSDDAIISISLNSKIMSWNHGAEKIYGYKADNVIDSSIMKIIPRGSYEDFSGLLAEVIRGNHVSRHETVNCHIDGHLFPVSVTLSPLVYHDGIIGVTMIARDISARRQTEDELKISHRRLKSLIHETVESLSTAHEKRDLYTSGHQRAVSMLGCCIADEMNLSHDRIEGIRIAGLLHDIGKVCIPMAILSKPAQLSPEEMALMRKHSQAGYEIVKNIPFSWPVKDIILQHHERIDGSGYPHGITGGAMLIESKILAVADTLEAMTAHRPYRPALGLDLALEEISRNSGITYDAEVCRAVLRLLEDEILRVEQNRLVCSL